MLLNFFSSLSVTVSTYRVLSIFKHLQVPGPEKQKPTSVTCVNTDEGSCVIVLKGTLSHLECTALFHYSASALVSCTTVFWGNLLGFRTRTLKFKICTGSLACESTSKWIYMPQECKKIGKPHSVLEYK
jgi:hypothetical protein